MSLPLVRGELAHLRRDLRRIRREPIFLRFVVRHRWHLGAAAAHYRRVEVAERLFGDQRGDLRPGAEQAVVLTHARTLPGLRRVPVMSCGVEGTTTVRPGTWA